MRHAPTLVAGAVLALAAPARGGGEIIEFTMTLDGFQEVGMVETDATGSGTATLDTATNMLSWSVSWQNLSGPATAGHFHGPAPICEATGVEVTILEGGGPATGMTEGSATLSAGQVADLLDGLWYVNIHTSLHPPGEIRGQVVPPPLADPLPPIPQGDVHVQLETVATGMTAPNWGTFAPGVDGRLFVTDQDGILWNVNLATGSKSFFLDVSPMLVSLGIFGEGSFDERGLLGVAFHPDYQTNGLLYTYTSEPDSAEPDFSTMPEGSPPNHQSVIREWQAVDPTNPDTVVDPGSVRELLRIDQPQFNHDAGALSFGPDGMLYVALGDGGAADDQEAGTDPFGVPNIGHGCEGNGRDPSTILGTIIRIDPQGTNASNGQYGIPADNPFVGMKGFVDEIFAYGFRNPFRFSFDTATGDLFAADVGQNDVEEVNIVVSGGNYGWNEKEGSFFFIPNGASAGYVTDRPQAVSPGLIDPIAEYDHDDGIAIIGGFVYRGTKIGALPGRYVFGEFAVTFANDGRLFYLDENDEILEFQLIGQKGLGLSLLGMAQDADGEIYALVNGTGTPFGETGMVLRIAPKVGDLDNNGVTGTPDLLALLAAWGPCPDPPEACPADLDMNGIVGTPDFLLLLANWGE